MSAFFARRLDQANFRIGGQIVSPTAKYRWPDARVRKTKKSARGASAPIRDKDRLT